MIINLILRCFGVKRRVDHDPDERLRNILIANKNKFSIDCDGVLRVNLDHPEVQAAMYRLMKECAKIKVGK